MRYKQHTTDTGQLQKTHPIDKLLRMWSVAYSFPFSAVTLLVGRQKGHPAWKKNWMFVRWWWRFIWIFSRLVAPAGVEQAVGQGGRMPLQILMQGARIGLCPPTFQWLHFPWPDWNSVKTNESVCWSTQCLQIISRPVAFRLIMVTACMA